MFEIFASTSCSVHRESSSGDTKKLLIWVSLQVKCILVFDGLLILAIFGGFGEKKLPDIHTHNMVLHNCTAKAKCCSK